MADNRPVIAQLQAELHQGAAPRQALIKRIEDAVGKRVVSYFTSFSHRVTIDDDDADMIEAMLATLDLADGLALVVNSPGGDGLAAERIIHICRTYAGGAFTAIVPKMAKSAATVICLGAEEVLMGETAELGPISPQAWSEDPATSQFMTVQAINVINTYEQLVTKAVNTKGNPAPYLQQLARYDARVIQELRDAVKLAEQVAIRALETGMMKGKTRNEIKRCIGALLKPELTSSHGRPIYPEQAKACKLKISTIPRADAPWPALHELYVRTSYFVSSEASKVVESSEHAFQAPVPLSRREE